MARLQSLFASFIKRHTLAREIPCFFATCVRDIPERRSSTTCSRFTSNRDLPTCRPSSFAPTFSCADALPDQVGFEFCDGANERHEKTPHGSAGINVVSPGKKNESP